MDEVTGLLPQVKLITFDCYGTLIDWETGIREAMTPQLAAGGGAWRNELFDTYVTREAKYESEAYRSYREILTAVEADLMKASGIESVLEPRLAESVKNHRPAAVR